MGKLLEIYDKQYKKLLIIPIILLILALGQIAYQYSTTGDFLIKGVGLKGGTTITINDVARSEIDIKDAVLKDFPKADINIRTQASLGTVSGYIAEVDIDTANSPENKAKLIATFDGLYPEQITDEKGEKLKAYEMGAIGSALGENFFRQTMFAALFSFLLMGIVILAYFRNFIPSIVVISCAAADIIEALAVANLMGMKISTAGIAGFLLLIGYSVDTDILLTIKVLKKKEGAVIDRVMGAVKTGLKMTGTTLVAVIAGIMFTLSVEIKQIMLIVLFGLIADILNTWITNVAIVRLYMDRKAKKLANKKDEEVKYF